MIKAYTFRIYPTKNQEVKLIRTLDTCRHLYNDSLSEKIHRAKINRLEREFQVFPWGKPEWISYEYSPGDLVKRLSLIQTTGWGEKRDKKDRSMTYTVKGVFNYGEYIRLANPIPGEKDIDIYIEDVKMLKYGSGLLFQSADKQKKDNIEKKGQVKKLSKKEQNILDMKEQKSIDDMWS